MWYKKGHFQERICQCQIHTIGLFTYQQLWYHTVLQKLARQHPCRQTLRAFFIFPSRTRTELHHYYLVNVLYIQELNKLMSPKGTHITLHASTF